MPIPVITVPQMREWEEASWAAGRSPDAVIAQVGRLLAEQILQLCAPKQKVLVLAGSGNNGRDARASFQHILARSPALIDVTDPVAALPRLHEALAANPDLIVDGLFGIGLNRPLSGAWLNLLNCLNEARGPIVAVDVPSGLNAETGEPEGAAVRAAWTFTLGAPKEGLLRTAASPYVGQLLVLQNIGLVAMPHFETDSIWSLASDFRGFPPRREASGHKGDFGHAVVFAGSPGYHGAAVLAAKGAQRAQPGLVTVITQEGSYLPVASQTQAAMTRSWVESEELPSTATALLCGPGLVRPDRPEIIKAQFQKRWLELSIPMVADASALDWLPSGQGDGPGLRVITPHPGEAARILGTTTSEVQNHRIAALRGLSQKFNGCWVILKGQHTLIGQARGPVLVNSSGNPQLAQGGSGDLLAGFITGLLAQPKLAADPAKAISHAVWAHGHAADALSLTCPNWTIEDLSVRIGLRAGV